MYDQHLALHHLDVKSGAWIYRVFLLPSTLQVDLAFVSGAEFRALAPTFRLMFGRANEPRHPSPPQPLDIIGSWLAVRTPCPELHCKTKVVASRIHDQWCPRSRACLGLHSPRLFSGPRPWLRSVAERSDSAIRKLSGPTTRRHGTLEGFPGRDRLLTKRNSKRRCGTCGALARGPHTSDREPVLRKGWQPLAGVKPTRSFMSKQDCVRQLLRGKSGSHESAISQQAIRS